MGGGSRPPHDGRTSDDSTRVRNLCKLSKNQRGGREWMVAAPSMMIE